MAQTPQSQLKELIIKGKEKGFLTYAEVNDHLPQDIFEPEQIEDIITIDECNNPKIVTIEVGGSGDIVTEEIIRGLHDSLRASSIALMENEILLGAGTIHSQMANSVREASD